MNESKLDQVFQALSDATRRGMLARLAEGEAKVKDLAAPFEMSQPAISKHLRVLEAAGLIIRIKNGRENIVRAVPAPAEQARDWISYYARFWHQQFDAVETILKAKGEMK